MTDPTQTAREIVEPVRRQLTSRGSVFVDLDDLERRIAAALTREAGAVPEGLEPCKGEQYAFEEWAKGERYDMTEHPLHYLFLSERTYAARQGWKAGVAYAHKLLAAAPSPPGSAQGASETDRAEENMVGEDWQAVEAVAAPPPAAERAEPNCIYPDCICALAWSGEAKPPATVCCVTSHPTAQPEVTEAEPVAIIRAFLEKVDSYVKTSPGNVPFKPTAGRFVIGWLWDRAALEAVGARKSEPTARCTYTECQALGKTSCPDCRQDRITDAEVEQAAAAYYEARGGVCIPVDLRAMRAALEAVGARK